MRLLREKGQMISHLILSTYRWTIETNIIVIMSLHNDAWALKFTNLPGITWNRVLAQSHVDSL